MSAALSREDVLRIAELARLDLTADEVELFTRQLAGILDYVEQIRALDTTGVPPTSHVMNRPVERDDVPVEPLERSVALANAPDAATESGLFKVPRVMG
ncbi:MAG TPA: Asp-tRNA(Asn)/Glu-tRNA(Gln) amidotransferase subunit GatC [Vicinamibacterales bacterium]|nr:Asp-tRNA(Asn)/Glu-tRNA(Gln) amidotransferase subunit GatC [Vicinamibacterales bacterium]